LKGVTPAAVAGDAASESFCAAARLALPAADLAFAAASVANHAGYVDTDMTQGAPGTISTEESITSQLKVLLDGRPLNGKFYNHMGEELPW
jgi:hypothetical protein